MQGQTSHTLLQQDSQRTENKMSGGGGECADWRAEGGRGGGLSATASPWSITSSHCLSAGKRLNLSKWQACRLLESLSSVCLSSAREIISVSIVQEWTDYLFELKKKSKSAADEELTNELEAMTDTLGA